MVARVAEIESSVWDRIDAITTDATTRVAALENVHAMFDNWRPRIENSVDSVRAELTKVAKLLERGALTESEASPSVLGAHQAAVGRPSASATNAAGPIGHRAAEST